MKEQTTQSVVETKRKMKKQNNCYLGRSLEFGGSTKYFGYKKEKEKAKFHSREQLATSTSSSCTSILMKGKFLIIILVHILQTCPLLNYEANVYTYNKKGISGLF